MNLIQNRPISPHLTIYQTQLNSLLSIFHRMSAGVLTTLVITLFFLWRFSMFFACDFWYYNIILNFLLHDWIFFGLFILITLIFFYHMLNGIRHIFWEFGYGLELSVIKKSGIFMIVILFFITAFFIFN